MNYYVGLEDDAFIRGEIPMTKQEIRIHMLAKARIALGDTVIDIGAGTGSLSVEAAFQSQSGQVYAIEREAEGIRLINDNAKQFGLKNIQTVWGSAPEALTGLPTAQVILIGGSGGKLTPVLTVADSLLMQGGRLVVSAITVETLQTALEWLQQRAGYHRECACLQVTRLRAVGSRHMFQALNPVYIISAWKQKHD